MQAKDIPDAAFLEIVREYNDGEHPHYSEFLGQVIASRWALMSDLVPRLGAPEKVVQAKAHALVRRGLVTGCSCGCRGDYELTVEGRAFLGPIHPT